MITHIVCWKYKPETTADERTGHIAALRSLPETVPGIARFEAGSDILHLERSFDTGLVAVFSDRAALDHYDKHPEHVKVAALGKRIAERVVSVDLLS